MKYPILFSEGRIGALRLKNRVVMPAMGTMLASADGEVTDHLIAYLGERAKGGVGLIITEVTSIEYTLGKAGAVHPRVDDNRFIPMLSRLATAVHKYDTRVFTQLHHAGRQGSTALTGGVPIVAPSAISYDPGAAVPRALETTEVRELVQSFILGALRCRRAGIDGVELHAAHGYLMNQFLSPQSNKRTDQYGGSFESRMRFVREVVEGIKATCGPDYPVIVRLSIDEFVDGGIDLDEGLRIARYMEDIGVDAINASVGTYENIETIIEPATFEQGWRIYIAELVKGTVRIPVIAVGVIREPEFAEKVLAEGKADLVAIGRGLLADPDWCRKSLAGQDGEIRKCISCLHCADNGLQGLHITCAVNVRAGREVEFSDMKTNGARRKVVVIGGGPAGMEAARVLALRDFHVVLFEQESTLGGQIRFGSVPRGKHKMKWLVDYLEGQLRRLQVDCRLKVRATLTVIEQENPYAVFVATGGTPRIPPIAGVNQSHVFLVEQALEKHRAFNQEKVAVVGAGMTGCETAELLTSNGNEVILIEQLPGIAAGAGIIDRTDLVKQLGRARVNILTGKKIVRIGRNSLIVECMETKQQDCLYVDKVVLSTGVEPDTTLFDKMAGRFEKVFLIGDARLPGKIGRAIRDGFEKAILLN